MEVYTDENPEELFGTLKDVIETGANEVYLVESKNTWGSADPGNPPVYSFRGCKSAENAGASAERIAGSMISMKESAGQIR